MDNDEIRALLRELKERSEAEDSVKSETIRISFEEEEPPAPKRSRKRSGWPGKKDKGIQAEEQPKKSQKAVRKKKERDWSEREEEQTKEGIFEEPDPAFPPKLSPAEASQRERSSANASVENPSQPEASQRERSSANASVENLSQPEASERERSLGKTSAEKTAQKKSAPSHSAGTKKPPKGEGVWRRLGLRVEQYFEDLKSKGIGGRELVMIAGGALLLLLILAAVIGLLRGEKKNPNVAADQGLTVKVLEEPENWCVSGTVRLSLHTLKPMQTITINGNSFEFEPGRKAEISLEADTSQLELMVVTEEQVLNAQVVIPMVDSVLPKVTVSQQNGQVTLTATDEGSGLEGIYYGTASGLSDIPTYTRYTGPFLYEEGKTYYYYAQDYAGNKTVPTATNMEPAEALEFSTSSLTLFPGDTADLQVLAVPAGAYCNNLQLTNQNPEIIRLDEQGQVTALKEGSALIEAEAEGLPKVSCQVTVTSQAEITISAAGDCTLGSDIYFGTANSFDTVWSMYGDSYFFQNVKSIFEEDDLTFVNFEGTLTTSDQRENKQYAFKGAPGYTNILKEGSVEAVTLANNHSSDYGAQSLADTKQYLTEAGIDYCIGDEIILKEVKGVKVALIGIYVLDTGLEKSSQVESTIASAKAQGADLIVVGFHWGSERSNYPDEIQKTLAHLAIDQGADLVVGHHPHVLQGIEQYQGKYIVYSLGNFCFGGNSTPSDMDTMIFQQTFTVTREEGAAGGEPTIIPCSVSSEAWWNNYQPTPVEGTEAERILGRIQEYSEGLEDSEANTEAAA